MFRGWLVYGEEAGSISLRGRVRMIRGGKTLRCRSHERKCKVWATSIVTEGLGARPREDLVGISSWDVVWLLPSMDREGRGHRQQCWYRKSFAALCPGSSCLRQRRGIALRELTQSRYSGETLPSSGSWAGDLNVEAPTSLVWDLPETRINWETLEILGSCGCQL